MHSICPCDWWGFTYDAWVSNLGLVIAPEPPGLRNSRSINMKLATVTVEAVARADTNVRNLPYPFASSRLRCRSATQGFACFNYS